jgi:uncharacterized protein (TIGR00369 family)
MEGHSVNYSRTTITELMIAAYANFGGKIHGGTLLSLMDKVAYACATRHAGTYCVTVSVDTVNFLEPVEVGELVSMKALVIYVGSSSLVIGIRVDAENVETRITKHTNMRGPTGRAWCRLNRRSVSGGGRWPENVSFESRQLTRRRLHA